MAVVSKEELLSLVGKEIGVSDWTLIDQKMVNLFADATGDHQFIHIDEEKAKLTPFGGTIAHGFLSLSLLPKLSAEANLPRLDGVKMGVNYGGNKTRFLAPVRVGKPRAWSLQDAGAGRKAPRPVAADHGIYAGD
jgi:acyl dehydratase